MAELPVFSDTKDDCVEEGEELFRSPRLCAFASLR